MALQGEREDADKSDLEQWKTQIKGVEEHSISNTTPEKTKRNQGRKVEMQPLGAERNPHQSRDWSQEDGEQP